MVDTLIGSPRAHYLGSHTLHGPQHFELEVTSGIRRSLLHREISLEQARIHLDELLTAPIEIHDSRGDLAQCLEWANTITIQDALYVALARRLGAPLVTSDGRLARAVRAHQLVEVIDIND